MQRNKQTVSVALVAFFLAGLAGCGGGGGGEEAQVDPEPLDLPQGIWRGTVGERSVSVLVLPTGESTKGELWAIGRDSSGTSLYKAEVSLTGQAFAGTGSLLTASPVSATPNVVVSMPGIDSPKATLTFTLGNDSADLTYASYYETPATLADWMGGWTNTQSTGLGSLVTTWTVASDGGLTGTRSDGCTYLGTVALRPEAKAVVNIAAEETCGSGSNLVKVNFSGIGTPGLDSNGNVVGRIATLLPAGRQGFSLLLFSSSTPP